METHLDKAFFAPSYTVVDKLTDQVFADCVSFQELQARIECCVKKDVKEQKSDFAEKVNKDPKIIIPTRKFFRKDQHLTSKHNISYCQRWDILITK